MSDETNNTDKNTTSIFVVSGGRGVSGNSLVQASLIQYPDNNVPVEILSNISTEEQLFEVIRQAKKKGAIIAHTMVDPDLRRKLNALSDEFNIPAVDLMGKLFDLLNERLDITPLKTPGLYHQVNLQYFDRVEAIEYTLSHDDGMDPDRLREAEIVLTGLSRAGKTPLSVYLAMYGWKVANVPLVKGIEPPEQLFEIDNRRVFGLYINYPQLIAHRHKRMHVWNSDDTNYTNEESVREEIRFANFIFEKGNFTVINVSNKPIESTANEILHKMGENFKHSGRNLKLPPP
ncbi:MAG: kinase/pyrophosphorylase [Prolixibacteraceae bacterium]|nr:kinase/pyrophosphorylase [Prolixibacteraceae bacterium]